MLPLWQLLGLTCAEEPSTPSNASTADLEAWRWASPSSPPSPWWSDSQSPSSGLAPDGARPTASRGDEDGSPSYPKSKTVRFREAVSFEEVWPRPDLPSCGAGGGPFAASARPDEQHQQSRGAQEGPILWHLLPGSH